MESWQVYTLGSIIIAGLTILKITHIFNKNYIHVYLLFYKYTQFEQKLVKHPRKTGPKYHSQGNFLWDPESIG